MQVSAISSNSYGTYRTNPYVNSRGYDNDIASEVSTPSENEPYDCSDCGILLDNVNQWKHFCHKQIAKGNFDIIA